MNARTQGFNALHDSRKELAFCVIIVIIMANLHFMMKNHVLTVLTYPNVFPLWTMTEIMTKVFNPFDLHIL